MTQSSFSRNLPDCAYRCNLFFHREDGVIWQLVVYVVFGINEDSRKGVLTIVI